MKFSSVTKNLQRLGSEKWELHNEARRLVLAGIDVIELTIGEPDIPPSDDLLEECIRSIRSGRTKYSNGRGEQHLLTQIKNKYNKISLKTITEKNILCFPGTQTALYATIRSLAEAGDEVLVGDPLYATYEGIIRASGAEMVTIPLRQSSNFVIDPNDLEKAITKKSRVILLNSPHNPTGSILTRKDFLKIADICVKHNLWVVSDEVYEELIFAGNFISPMSIENLANRTVSVSSISKSHAAPGFRSGWAIGPEEFCTKALPLSETMLFGNQPFIADMTAYALSKPSKTASKMRVAYHRRAKLICKMLRNVTKVKPFMPSAGMFILINIKDTNLSCYDFAWKLLREHNVAVMPGDSFGQQATDYIRISLTVPDKDLIQACDRIAKFVKIH